MIPSQFFFKTRQFVCLIIDIAEKIWPVYKENWPKTDDGEVLIGIQDLLEEPNLN